MINLFPSRIASALLSLGTALLLVPAASQAQTAPKVKYDYIGDRPNPFVISLSLGVRPMRFQQGTVNVAFTDESKNPATYTASRSFPDQSFQPSLNLEFEKTFVFGLVARVGSEYTWGSARGVNTDGGLGYCWRFAENWRVIPSVNYVFQRNNWFNVGSVTPQEGRDFVVKGEFYQSGEKIDLSLEQRFRAWKPQIMVAHVFSTRLEARATVGYMIANYGSYDLRVTGMGKDGDLFLDRHSVRRSPNDPNVNINFNGARLRRAPINVDGFYAHIGLGIRI